MSWIEDIISPKTRKWEEFYRNRWQRDKVVRSTHGVNCTGGCSWAIHVKEGIVDKIFYPTGDIDKDMREIMDYYKDKTHLGKYPNRCVTDERWS